eukprot:TRINITY_DN21696_c0_g2_i1.p1 TRINITY_DN21696_c0_g2~~TRINITY_DN21696_c0_g2_i1.p1  ORF type:complete len:344 (-),score=42.38 TRINITY_DN21696_c0_g2_i1:271-1302(-)
MKRPRELSFDEDESRKHIRKLNNEEFVELYTFHDKVMESSNSGMDVRYATRLSDNQKVVIKTRAKMTSFKGPQDEQEWRYSTVQQLTMPKVATLCELFEVLETDQTYYIVMEKVEGKDLYETLAIEHLTVAEGREIVKQILDGLIVLQNGGRIHKDLKIENVMVDRNSPKFRTISQRSLSMNSDDSVSSATSTTDDTHGEVKLIDFDTVEKWEPTSPKAMDVLGTDGYIAPEAYAGVYSPASDVYAIGVVLYRLLTGMFPSSPELFDDGPGENWVGSPAMRRIRQRLRREQINFTLRPFDKIPEAADLCRKMLSYHADDRPSAEQARHHDFFLIRLDSSRLAH